MSLVKSIKFLSNYLFLFLEASGRSWANTSCPHMRVRWINVTMFKKKRSRKHSRVLKFLKSRQEGIWLLRVYAWPSVFLGLPTEMKWSKLPCCSRLKCTVFSSVPAGWTVFLWAVSWTQKKSELKYEYLGVISNCCCCLLLLLPPRLLYYLTKV